MLQRVIFIFLIVISSSLTAQTRNKVGMRLIEASNDMPKFQISRVRTEKGPKGRTRLKFDYKRLRQASNIPVEVGIRIGNEQTAERMFWSGLVESGTYSVVLGDDIASKIRSQGAEVFVFCELLSSRRSGSGFQDIYYRFKVSESLTTGRAKIQTQTAAPNSEELRRIESWRKFREMREAKANSIPEGWVAAREARVTMPGMKMRIMKDDVWLAESHEYIGKDASSYLIYRVDDISRDIGRIGSDDAIFLEAEVTKHFESPSYFKPSLKLIPKTGLLIPEGFILRPTHTKIVNGMPVKVHEKYYRDDVLYDGFVLSRHGFKVLVRYRKVDRRGTIDGWEEKEYPLDKVLVSQTVMDWIEQGDAEERFKPFLAESNQVTPLRAAGLSDPIADAAEAQVAAAKIEAKQAASNTMEPATVPEQPSVAPAMTRKLKSYPIKITLPNDASVVALDDPLQPGTKLGCSWANKWYFVTVLGWYNDGAVRIRWDDFGENWDCDVARSDLAILQRTKRLLARDATSPKAGPRKWSDQSGKFSVMAYAKEIKDGTILLGKPDGSQISVPISKLSEKDQKLLKAAR